MTDTVLHPAVAVAMAIAVILIVVLPRKKAIVPFLLAFLTIPAEQVLVLGGVHFTMPQILILTVLGRMGAFRGSPSEKRFSGGFNALDKVVVLWSLSALIIFALEFMDVAGIDQGPGGFGGKSRRLPGSEVSDSRPGSGPARD